MKISDEKRKKIFDLVEQGYGSKKISKFFNCTPGNITLFFMRNQEEYKKAKDRHLLIIQNITES